jgi:hypothetical protein
VGGLAHANQAFLFQEIDLVSQCNHLGGFKRSQLFVPSPLELRESANNWRDAGLMVLAVEPGSMPSPKRAFQWKIKEVGVRVGLEAYAPDNLLIGGAWLVFQEKIAFK